MQLQARHVKLQCGKDFKYRANEDRTGEVDLVSWRGVYLPVNGGMHMQLPSAT